MDLHTSDGSAHGYHLTYSPPLNPNTNATIMSIMKDEWFPFVTKAIRDKYKWETFYYGNAGGGGRGGGRGADNPDRAPGAAVQRVRERRCRHRLRHPLRHPHPLVRRPLAPGARSSTSPAFTTTTSACATASRC